MGNIWRSLRFTQFKLKFLKINNDILALLEIDTYGTHQNLKKQ